MRDQSAKGGGFEFETFLLGHDGLYSGNKSRHDKSFSVDRRV
ncbi:hypothetical protein ALP29_200851 [Pseudomonas syringae pv. avii]|uniref:Uncharacterized protein n=1 Tax=Pseudomonas syringae pv. avii TaxID=663959 RepID=A0A3M5TYQ0_PSESX|nr:hypothetical protein ALP29_200851 [Pseudomonas syringae pv. avii]